VWIAPHRLCSTYLCSNLGLHVSLDPGQTPKKVSVVADYHLDADVGATWSRASDWPTTRPNICSTSPSHLNSNTNWSGLRLTAMLKREVIPRREAYESQFKEVLVCTMDRCREPVGIRARSWRLKMQGPSYRAMLGL
jgi:hypothetical protein